MDSIDVDKRIILADQALRKVRDFLTSIVHIYDLGRDFLNFDFWRHVYKFLVAIIIIEIDWIEVIFLTRVQQLYNICLVFFLLFKISCTDTLPC